MQYQIDISEFLINRAVLPVIDVRSPCEFIKGHIPHAINIPLFSDDERDKVGKNYVQKGSEEAMFLALQIIGPKLEQKVLLLKEKISGNKILIYCWRGGMRSNSMAWLFSLFGYEVFVLTGGYKSFRKFVKESFSNKLKLIVIAGMTGTGKTDLLELIQQKGYQTINLEKLANHKGSVFGGLGMPKQHSVEQFENILYDSLSTLDQNMPVFIEDESINIGRLQIPRELFDQMQNNPVIEIQRNNKFRIALLEAEYAKFDQSELIQSVNRIEKRLGKENTKKIIIEIENKNYSKAAEILLIYYDKAYRLVMDKREKGSVKKLFLDSEDLNLNADQIIREASSIY
jgi:tRNA 2-selenouridine synthase